MKNKLIRNSVLVCVVVLLVAGLGRAALRKCEQRREAIMAAAQKEQKRLGLTDRETLYSKHPSPEIQLVQCPLLAPGDTTELVVKGKFQPGTQFVITSDNIEVLKENVTTTEYRATIKAAAGVGPDYAGVEAFTPVSGANDRSRNAIFIGGKFVWDLKATNGWRIKAHNDADTRGSGRSSDAAQKYTMEFFRADETTPFATREASLYYDPYGARYSFSISDKDEAAADFESQLKTLSLKMSDPNVSDAEREKAMEQLQKLSEKMMAEASDMAAMQKRAAAQEAKKREFGCGSMSLTVQPGGAVSGDVLCGKLVGQLQFTGTMTFVGK